MPEAQAIDTLLDEQRRVEPDPAFAAQAIAGPEIYERAASDLEGFWRGEADSRLSFYEPFDKVLEWELPYAKWFLGGKLNASYNCVDRHVEAGLGEKVAYYWEGEPEGDRRVITYSDLQREVARFANVLLSLGVKKGGSVGIYLGMVPEIVFAMLACARIGASHNVVFGGFSAESLSGRLNDSGATVVVTADGAFRRGSVVPLKAIVDDALRSVPSVSSVVVVRRTGNEVAMAEGRDHWYHEAAALVPDEPSSCPPEAVDSEHMLYLLYSSGTTAKPKAIVHTTAGYLLGVATTHQYIFDIKPQSVYWCAADVGWVTGHSYIVYGPLMNATTSVMYEGTPDYPDKDRWWSIIERYKVSVLYCAPTAIRTFMKWGPEYPAKHDMSSLRVLGTVGEPINPEAWVWYRHFIGADRVPVVDTWWQTETGMAMITPLPGVTTLKPGSATMPFPGVTAEVVNDSGEVVAPGKGGGYLCIIGPWPAMLRGLYNDHERYMATYWSRFPGKYFAGDGARQDEDGSFWLMGRVDDVMNVSGHRISTIEVESALVDHPDVAEAAVAPKPDPITGQAIVAYVTLKAGASSDGSVREGSPAKAKELRDHVASVIGAIAKPKHIVFTPELPKTRSGKIMRRLLRDVAAERPLGDTTTLADPTVVEAIRDHVLSSGEED
ncbi:MAG: acetate--CoA ligase [Acidimicrobiales bacterium]